MEDKAAVGARCRGGVKTPPYEGKMQWQLTQSGGAGQARPQPGGGKGYGGGGGRGGGGGATPPPPLWGFFLGGGGGGGGGARPAPYREVKRVRLIIQ